MIRLIAMAALISWLCLLPSQANAQFKVDRVQFHYGLGSQQVFPFQSGSYNYNAQFFKLHLGFPVVEKNKWSFSWNLEPSLFLVKHQLTNKWYKLDERDAAYAAKIPSFLQVKRITEYVLNIGFQLNYAISQKADVYGLISAGPMYSNTETERLARGFAFSDIVGIGFQYSQRNVTYGIRFSMRHVSNANLKYPNNGHNSSNVEIVSGILLDR